VAATGSIVTGGDKRARAVGWDCPPPRAGGRKAPALRSIAAAVGIYNPRPRGSTAGNVSGLLRQLAEAAVKWPDETTVRVYAAIRGVHEDTARSALSSKAGHGPGASVGNGEDA